MKKLCVILSVLLLNGYNMAAMSKISYTVESDTGNQWTYHYTVSNLGLPEGIEEFTIWFEYGKYTSLQIVSDPALYTDWDQIVWQPNEVLLINGGFDALTRTAPINIGDDVSGFAVSFAWTGSPPPGKQFYEIINPVGLAAPPLANSFMRLLILTIQVKS